MAGVQVLARAAAVLAPVGREHRWRESTRGIMHTLVRQVGLGGALRAEAPALAGAWVIAEMFYKFHSFTLECAGFLATWYVLSVAWNAARRRWSAAPRPG